MARTDVIWRALRSVQTVKAIYENGVFKPTEPVQLQERTEIEVLIPMPLPADPLDASLTMM